MGTSEEKVKEKYPDAFMRRWHDWLTGIDWYTIFDGTWKDNPLTAESQKTAKKAWDNALANIMEGESNAK